MKATEFQKNIAKENVESYFASVKAELARMTQYVEESEANFNKAHEESKSYTHATNPVDFLTFCVSRIGQFDSHAEQAMRAVESYTKAN